MKIFRELLQLFGMLISLAGLIICMCECQDIAAELIEQLHTSIIGFVTFVIGTSIVYIGTILPESVNV